MNCTYLIYEYDLYNRENRGNATSQVIQEQAATCRGQKEVVQNPEEQIPTQGKTYQEKGLWV